jgi:CTP synthase
VHGILVPGGLGERGTFGKIEAARFARTRKVPYFGICFGMQMAVIEAARNLAGARGCDVNRVGPCKTIGRRPHDRMDARQWLEKRRRRRWLAARCGSASFRSGARARQQGVDLWQQRSSERHRHRYEVNLRLSRPAGTGRLRFHGTVAGRRSAGDLRTAGPPLVHWRAVPPGTEVTPVRAASPACELHRGGGARSRLV